MINVVSKSNWQYQQQRQAQRVPHYGLRKLSVGVASVLLSTTLYMGVSAHADTVVTPSETSTPSTTVTTPNLGATETTSKAASLSANDVNGANVTSTNSTSEVPTSQVAPVNTSVTPEKPVDSTADAKTGNETSAPNMAPKPVVRAAVKPVVNAEATETTSGSFFSTTGSGSSNSKSEVTNITSTSVESDRSDVQLTNTSVALLEMVKPATAWQPEPTTNYSADHTAKIDMTNQPTTVQGDNWQMSLDKNYIKAGQAATLTVNYEAQAGDTFVLDIGYPAGVNAQPLSSQIGTTSTKDNGLRTQVINVFKQAGTYTQAIKLNGWKTSAEGLNLLRHVFGDQTFDLTLKRGTSVENAQDVGRLYLTSSFTPTMSSTGSVGVDRIDAKYVPVLSTNNNYIFTVRTNWSDFGTALEPSYNGDFVYSISVPKTFELDQAATEAFYQQIHNNELFGNWGNRGSNVTVSQAGVGAPVIIKANALDRVAWHYVGNEGVSFLGHFIDAPSVATMVTAEGQTTVSDTIGNHTQTVILPGLAAKVINAADYNYDDSGDTVLSVSDYGDDNQLYQSHEVPMTGNGNSVRLIHDLSISNNSPFDVKNATVTLTFGDGLHVDVDSVRNNSYISNLLADNYIHPNREKSLLVTYQDGTSEMVPFNSKGDPTKNIKSITLTRDWNASQMAGMHGDGIRGFVASTYQDGSPVKIGDTIKVSLTVAGVNTAGHNVSKTAFDTLKVVDQRFAPLTTRSFYGGIDKTGLGDNPSGTINIHWDRTSGERSKIQLENPTIYFVMPNTVAQIQNPRWGFQKDLPGNVAPTLTSITYEKSKDGKNTVAIMHFSGTLIDQAPNNYVPLFFDGVNKDNVVNQTSEGFLYWTADNVNADGLTKIDPTRADSQNKVAHLPADLTQEQLNKIYLHSPYWGSIDMATGMYSTSATKTATTPWQTQTIVDYHGDGQADLGVNLVNDTSNALHNVVAIINLPKATNSSGLTANLTGKTVELIDPNTDRKLTDEATVLYSTKLANLSSNDLSSFVAADQIKDWSKVQAVAVILQNLGGMTSRQVQIPVVVNDLVANAGKAGTVGTRISADELKPIIVSADAENAAKLVVGGQATIHVQMHYQDAQGKDHYVPLTNPTHAYDILQHHVLNSSDFTPSTTDLAQIPGYELSKTSPTIISGKAVIGQPVSAQDDDSVLQFELVPSAQKVLINYVDDDDNQKVIKTDTLTGKTGETQQINVVTPDNYVLVNPATNPSEYTFLASDNKPITIHLKHQRNTTQEEKTVTRKVTITTPDNKSTVTNQTVTFTRNATVDEVTGNVTYGPWSENGKHEFATVDVPNVPGYTATGDAPSLTVTPESKDTNVTISYTANDQTTQVVFVDDDDNGKTVSYEDIHGKTGETQKLTDLPENYELANGQSDTITFSADTPKQVTVHLKHKVVTKQLKLNTSLSLLRLIKNRYNVSDAGQGNYLMWISNDEFNSGKYDGNSKDTGSVTGSVQYDLVSKKVVKINNGETLKIGKTLFNYPSDDDVANGGSLTGPGDFFGHTFTQWMNEELKDNLSYKAYASANLTKDWLANKEWLSDYFDGAENVLVPFIFENGKKYGSDYEIDTSTIDNSFSIKFSDLGIMDNRFGVDEDHNGLLISYVPLIMPIVYQPYINKTVTRTINVTSPDKTVKTIKQTAEINQNVGGDIDSHQNGYLHKGDAYVTDNNWTAYTVPTIDGYTASQNAVEAVAVNGNTTDQTVNISYTANKQQVNINYVDINDGNKVVHTTTVNGVTDGDTNVPNELPAGYKLVDGQSVPKTIHFNANNNDINVKVQHSTVMVTPDSPKTPSDKLPDNPSKSYPSGVAKDDLSKTVTRKVTITTPDGKQTVTNQAVTFTRNAIVDEITGNVTYGFWSENGKHTFVTVDVPTVPGYTANSNVPSLTVTPDSKDTTVTISYTANKQQININYVDVNDGNKVVHTTIVNGVTDGDSVVPNELPAGYKLVDSQSIPKAIHFNADNNDDINIKVQHATVTVTPDSPKTSSDKLPDNPNKTYPSGVSENDLNKTVTRTIKVTQPNGTTTKQVQTVKLTRTATVDEVTGEVTYGKWSTGQWGAYDVPTLPGYTATQTEVVATSVDEHTTDQTVDISYTPNKQTTTIKYVDNKGEVVHTTTVDGVTNQTVKVSSEVPDGWTITKGQVPSEITFGPDGHDNVTVTVEHQHVTVTPDNPQTNGTKLPDNPTKTFNGVAANDLNKAITRTIKVTTPDGKVATVKQEAKLTRTADVDEVTGEVTYGKWTTGEWPNYDVPTVPGYTASQTSVAATPVDENTKDQTVDINYTANPQTTHVNYVDTQGNLIHVTTVNGQTNQTVKVSSEIPDGWKLVDGQTVPNMITFGPDGHADMSVKIEHQHVTVTPDKPQANGTKLPDNPSKTFEGVEANDLNKTITRTIKVTTPNGKTTTTKQTAKLTRTADVDEVTGEVTYGNWTTGEWAAYDAPSVVGYTPSQTAVAKESVTATSKDTTVEITYLPMQHQISVEYVDDDDHGKIVKTDQMPGKTDQTITVTPSAPSNYDLVDNGNRTYTVTSNDAQVVQIHVKHHQVTTSESKTVTRTINVHTPHDGTKVVKQNAELTRKVTTDQVTGEKTYGDWTTGQWESYTPEAIPGYTPSTNEVPNTNVNGNSKNQMIDVTYTADAQKVEIVYVDDTKGDAVVKTDQIAGKTDETVKVTPDVPAGYELVGKVPGDYTMTAGGHQTITVHLVHQMKTVSESKTVTRTINVHTPHDGAKTIKQTAELTRDVTTDQVTGEKTYGDWSTAEWDRYAVPAIAGYVPSVEQVAQQVVNGITTDQIIDVTYSSGEHTTHINYVDGDGNIVHTTTIKGQTDGTAQVPNETPAGWTVVGEPVPTELAFGPDGHSDVTVTVDHQHVTVTPDQPKTPTDKLPDNPAKTYPNGVGHDDLNKTITRTIKITMPDGRTKTVAQTAKLTRTADVDEVTGEVTYGKWTTGEWSNYDVPTVPGYTPSQSEVPAQTVSFGDNDIVKTVTYKANGQKLKVAFIDHTTGKTLNTIEKTGLSDTDSGYNTKADISDYAAKHYDLVSDGTNGQNLVFDHDDGKDQHYEVHLVHATHPIDEQVSTKQTIHYQLVDGTKVFDDHTAQVDFSRDGYNDEVTNENHWNKWTPSDIQTFSKVVSPVKSGYTPDKASVAAADVHPGDKNGEETVIYSPDKQVMTINYIDDVTGKTLSTKQITGFSDASANYNTKSSINSYVAGHYKLVSDDTNSDNLVFDHADSIDQVYNVHLTHSYQKVDDHKSVNETVHYIYDDGQTARPDYKAPAINFSRTGTKDLVTSNIVWNTWTPAEQNFDQVTTPAISGYTPDVEVVPSVNVSHGSDDLERTVIYHADDQTILVNYIDDDTHSTLKTDTVIGKTAQKSNYTTKKSIDGYIADHYKLVSDDTNDNELVFDSDSTKAQVYNVHLKHVHQNVSDSALVNETIHYVYADGSKARNDYHAPVISFKRTGDKDLVTNAIVWNDWIPASQDFKAVDSPVIDGYTPSQKTISNITVKPGDKDIDQTVVYAPDTQSIVVNYIDDVTGKTLKTDTLTGKSDRASDYTTKNNINGYENQHYVLVSDDTQGKTLTFDHDDKATQVYNVHLSHQTELASQSRTVHETINYVYADGSKASDTVTTNPLTFTQTGVKDLVTNVIAWNDDWTSKQTFAEVKSPEITGYTASRTSVGPITVDHNSSDIHQTVIYTANDQTARINYIDDVTGKTLETDSANGKFGDQINFGHDVDTQIKVFEGQGYKFKSNSFNGQKYQADNSQNEFEIHFTHGTQNVSRTNKVTEIVKYQFVDGRQAQKDHVQTVEFTQHGVQDLVTKTTVWTPSDPQTFASVDTPHITGYTSDIQNVPAATVNFGDEDIVKTVTYKANQQKLDVVFIDDVTGQVLKTANKIGLSDTDSGYNTKADISDYAAKHYDLVSDGTNGKNLMFDHDDNTDQHYEVHLTHHKSDTSRQSTVNETIHYVYENSKQAADDYVAKPIVFTQTGVKDLVTGDTDWNGQWTSDQEFKAVDSPEITGYTPSQKTVDAIKVSHDTSDIKRVVTYVANNQVAKITYIDDVTGKVLATDEVSGKFGSRVDYNALVRINSFEKQGYQLKTNGFDQPSYQADDTKNQFEIRLIHQLNKTSRESTVTRTISYVDSITGLTLHQPIIQTLKFIEDGVTDLVTNETTWQTASRQQFVSVKVPEIKGYASELSVVEPAEVGFGDANIETTVKYKKLDVTNTISYVDSQGKVIKTDTVSGQSGTEIKLDVPSGYHLVDNQTKVTISENETKQEVMIAKDDVTNTISYVDSQGKVIKANRVSGQSGTEIKLDVPSGYHLVDNQTKVTISENNSTQTVKITKDNSANKIARHLPQTGNQRETGLVALGLATGLLGLVVLRKKRN